MFGQIMSESTVPPRKRRRPALSCVQCRRRKVKCDRKNPCTQCTTSKITSCTYKDGYPGPGYSSRSAVSGPTRSKPNSGLNDVGHIFSFTQDSRSFDPTARMVPLFDEALSKSSTLYSPSIGSPEELQLEQNVQVLLNRVKKLEETLDTVSQGNHAPQWTSLSDADCPGSSTSFFGAHPKVAVPELRGSVSKTRLFGQSHWMSAFEHFRHISTFRNKTALDPTSPIDLGHHEIKTSEIRTLLEKCKTMARAAKAERPVQWHLNPSFKDYIPPRELSDKLVYLYRKNFESTHRILHLPTFEREYEDYWKNPEQGCVGLLVKMLLVMAIGTTFYQGDDFHEVRATAQQWVYAAQSWVSAPSEKGHLNLNGLQTHCLVHIARQTTGVGGDLVWISVGSLVRMAMTMGFHRDPKLFPKMNVLHAELRRRLWATVLEMAVASSFDSGNPPLLTPDDWDTEPPSNINDCEISETTKVAPTSKPYDVYTQASLQIQLLKSVRTRLEISRLITNFRVQPSYNDIIRLGTKVTNFAIEGQLLGQNIPEWGLKPTTLQRNLLDTPLRRTLLALHFPYAMKARTDPRFYFSRKVCLDAALTIITYPSTSSPSNPNPLAAEGQDDYTRLKLVGGGFFKETFIYAAMILQLEIIAQLEEEPPLMRTELSRKSREPLEKYISHMTSVSAQRIMLGENNIKGHLFLSTVGAQIDAMERRVDPDPLIAKAARDSAEACYALLKSRIKKPPSSIADKVDVATSPGENSNREADMRFQDIEMDQDFSLDYLMPDASTNLDFEIPESWLFEGWEDHHHEW